MIGQERIPTARIAWAPRSILAGRTFRLAVADPGDADPLIRAPGFSVRGMRRVPATWVPSGQPDAPWEPHGAFFAFLTAPDRPGPCRIGLEGGRGSEAVTVTVLGMGELAESARRWRSGAPWESTKTARVLQDEDGPRRADPGVLRFWLTEPDDVLWRQLPPAELPKAHFVNEHHGCPVCGTQVFRHGGFYPWTRSHLPCTFLSTCPACASTFPSNRLADGDYTSGSAVDDGYGYFDEQGRLYLFAATYHRDQVRAFCAGIAALTAELRVRWDEAVARRLGLLLVRYAVEELYVAASPQFRYGPSRAVEQPWPWGQEDWLGELERSGAEAAFGAKGTLHYSIDTPHTARLLSLAFDTIWPLLRADVELADRARAMGAPVRGPEEANLLVEQMLACLLQCILDLGARANLPEESLSTLVVLRALDRSDARDVMDWLYDTGPDRLRVFNTNDFLPDGSPPEATGGYNSIHTNGLFALEHEVRAIRARHPRAYPESRYPSVLDPSRARRCILQPLELVTVGRSWFQYGDGSAPGTPAEPRRSRSRASLALEPGPLEELVQFVTCRRAREYVDDPAARTVLEQVMDGRAREIGTTLQDRVGIAVLRTRGAPERAAAGVAYGDTMGHRHMDLGDVQLFAHGRPFLTDLGYPQSWASIAAWEGHWATHNTAWAVQPGTLSSRVAGRGRIVSYLRANGVQVLDIAMDRWARAPERGWQRLDMSFRRLIALVETDGEGVALVDLSRVRGGTEHWRICRGLEGALEGDGEWTPRSGPGDPETGRGFSLLGLLRSLGGGREPDHDAFAFMDEVESRDGAGFSRGTWQSSIEPGVFLDIRHLASTKDTELFAARATQAMGTPEQSAYAFRALAWRRAPSGPEDVSAVDLVLEPRIGDTAFRSVRAVAVVGDTALSPAASGVEMLTLAGRRIRLHWSPWAADGTRTSFADGVVIDGSLRLEADGCVACAPGARRVAISAMDRRGNTVEVSSASPIEAGARVRCAREGAGFSYEVVRSEAVRGARRLTLDVSSVLGVSRVAAVGDGSVDLADPLLTRTGYLTGARLVSADPHAPEEAIAEVADGVTLEDRRTRLWLRACSRAPRGGERVQIVDYVAGDVLET